MQSSCISWLGSRSPEGPEPALPQEAGNGESDGYMAARRSALFCEARDSGLSPTKSVGPTTGEAKGSIAGVKRHNAATGYSRVRDICLLARLIGVCDPAR